jgi:hypothetical protein
MILRYSSQPAVKVLAGTASWSYDSSTGDLRFNYIHNGLIRVQVVSSAGTLSLLLADYPRTATFLGTERRKPTSLGRRALFGSHGSALRRYHQSDWGP